MNYPRIIKFSLSLIILNIVLGAVLSYFFKGLLESQPQKYVISEYVLAFILGSIVYTVLSMRQAEKPYKQAFFVALFTWIIDIFLGVFINYFVGLDFEPLIYLVPLVFTILEVSLGTFVGIKIRESKTKVPIET